MGISKKLKMIKNNEYLIFKMKKTLLFFTAIINFIGFSFFVNADSVKIGGPDPDSTDYTFENGETLTLENSANASGKLNFNSGSIFINSTTDGGDQITGEVNTVSGTDIRIIALLGNTLTISAIIGGPGSVNKDGEGILILNQSNVYTGTTTISDGTLQLDASGTLSDSTAVTVSSKGTFDVNPTNTIASIEGSGTIDIETGATLTAGDANDKEFSGTLTGAGRFTKAGTGILDLSGTNSLPTYSISEGTLRVRGSSTLRSGNLLTDLSNNGHFWYNSSSAQTIAGDITGTGSLQKTRTSTLTLTGTNTYSGSTTIGVGTLRVDGTLSDSSAITINANGTYDVNNSDTVASIEGSGIIDIASSTTLTAGDANDKEFSGVIQGAGNFSKLGSGTLTLSGTNTYTGSTTINAGTISVASSANLGATPGLADADNIIFNGGTLNTTADFTLGANKGITMTGAGTIDTDTGTTLTFAGSITDSGTLTKTGAGTLSLTGTSDNSGGILVSAGKIEIGNNASLGTGTITLNGGTLSSDSTTARTLDEAIAISSSSVLGDATNTGKITLSGSSTFSGTNTLTANSDIELSGSVDLGSATQTFSVASGKSTTLSGAISSGAISKSGDGTLIISADNDYASGTTVSAGTLRVSGSGDLGTGSLTIGASGTLDLRNTLAVASLEISGAGSGNRITNGDADGTTANLTVSGTSTLNGAVNTDGTQTYSGTTTLGSDVSLTGSTVSLAAISGGTNALAISGNLDLSGAASSLTTLSVSGTSDIGADVTTTGTQSYTGTTTVSASSTLNGTEITAAAAVLDNNLNITNSSSSSFTGAISGTGNLTKAGSGTLTLSGTNSYTGDTTISAGTLTVSGTLSNSTTVSVASGAIYDVDATDTIASVDGAGTVDIASSTTLTTGDTNDQELSGTVSGAGSLTKAGSGILTLSGTNSYSGNTNISAGILLVTSQLGEGTYAGNISNSGDFGINSSSNQTLSGVISGSGTINKSGTGELTLTGTNTFNGTINVAGGTLFAGTSSDGLNDITLGDIIVKGGTLGGGGVVGGDVSFTTTGGTLAPGNSIGILTVSGDLTLSADDTTEIEFNASSADKIVVNGNTILAGTISLFPENTTYSDRSHIIVDASAGGTFSGTFATETMNNQSNLNGATWDIVYDTIGKTVKLDLTEAETSSNLIKDTTTVNKFKDVATVFDNATTGQLKEIKDVLNSATVNSVNTELGKLKGTVLASTFTQPTLNHNNFNRALTSVTSSNINTSLVSSFTSSSNELTLASLQDAGLYGDKKNFNEYFDYSDTSVLGFVKNNKNRSIFNDFQSEDSATFIRTYGTTADRDNINSNYTGYDSETTGILFGQQFKNDEETFTGYSYGFTGTDTDYKNNYGESKTYSVHASLFKQYDKKDHGLNLISGMYVSKTESERNVSVFGTSVNDKYVSDYWDVGINQEVQYIKKYKFGEISVSPSAKLNSTYVFKSDTEETGGELALNVDNDNLFLVKPELGISIGVDLSKKDNINNELSLAMFASQDHFIDGTTSNARYSSGSSFNVDLPRDQETYYSLGLGYNFLNKETDTSLMANAFLMQNEESDMNSNIFSLTFRKLFGDFAKGNVPPVIAKKPENDQEVIKEASPKDKNTIKKVEKTLEEFEENIEIVLKESPTEQEVAKVYESISNNSQIKRQLTLNDVYNNLSANCYAIENKLVHLVNYYDKQQLYKILDKCNKLSDPKIHLIANRLHQIQQDETTAYQKIYFKYLRILSYLPFVTFVAFIILAYEFIRRYIVNHFRAKNTV